MLTCIVDMYAIYIGCFIIFVVHAYFSKFFEVVSVTVNPQRSHLWKVSQRSHGVWDTPATSICCQLKSIKYFRLKEIFIYSLSFSIVKRKPQTTNRMRSRSNFQRTTDSYLPSNCWGVRHPCEILRVNTLFHMKKLLIEPFLSHLFRYKVTFFMKGC